MKHWLGIAAITAGVLALAYIIWLFFFSNAGTFVSFRGVPTAEPAGYCTVNGRQLDGLFTFAGCSGKSGWEKWCDVQGNCQYAEAEFGLCAKTQAFGTNYSTVPDASQCQGARHTKFYANCSFTPGRVPPWSCQGGEMPPPVPSWSGEPGDPAHLALCALTDSSSTEYVNENLTYELCQLRGNQQPTRQFNFYPECTVSPGPLPWECGSNSRQSVPGVITQ